MTNSFDVRIPSTSGNGLVLAATLHLPGRAGGAEAEDPARDGGNLPGLVVGHGAGSNRRRHGEFSHLAAERGFAVLTLDFRGHGESGGRMDGEAATDVLDAAAFLRERPEVDADRVVYRGSSMGAYLGLVAAPEARFAALALLCPANERVLLAGLDGLESRREEGQQRVTARMDLPALRESLAKGDVFRVAERIREPVFIVHARGDATVPFQDSVELARRLPGRTELLLLEGGDHGTAQRSPEVHERVLSSLWRAAG